MDASFGEVTRNRNRRAENEAIKRGEVPAGWQDDPKRLSHEDRDARWTQKNHVSYYGYKNHLNMDAASQLIIRSTVTDASVHDSQALDAVTGPGDGPAFLDSGSVGPAGAAVLAGKGINRLENTIMIESYAASPGGRRISKTNSPDEDSKFPENRGFEKSPKDFLFETRQKPITFDEDHYFVDRCPARFVHKLGTYCQLCCQSLKFF